MKKIVRLGKAYEGQNQFDLKDWSLPEFDEKINLAKEVASEALRYAFEEEIFTCISCGWDAETDTYKGTDIGINLGIESLNLELKFNLGDIIDEEIEDDDDKERLLFIKEKLQAQIDKIDKAIEKSKA
jgi:hypothetical protein